MTTATPHTARPHREQHGTTPSPDTDITRLLEHWPNGDPAALGEAIRHIDAEIHRVARQALAREPAAKRLQTTELINEAYLRLLKQGRVQWQNRSHFLGIAAQIMRRILVDRARQRKTRKRDAPEVPLDIVSVAATELTEDYVALDEALRELTRLDPRQAQVIELRYFGGYEVEETAEILGIAPVTVKRDTRSALAWLERQLNTEAG